MVSKTDSAIRIITKLVRPFIAVSFVSLTCTMAYH